jgi:hypothetical protein
MTGQTKFDALLEIVHLLAETVQGLDERLIVLEPITTEPRPKRDTDPGYAYKWQLDGLQEDCSKLERRVAELEKG